MFENSLHFPFFLVGMVFIFAGIIMFVFPPKNINSLYGYRTKSSMKNQENWDFSQKYSAKLLVGLGLFFVALFLITNHINNFLPLNEFVDLGIILASVFALLFLTEKAIKNKFPN
jgi:uncharacterized membrane protein